MKREIRTTNPITRESSANRRRQIRERSEAWIAKQQAEQKEESKMVEIERFSSGDYRNLNEQSVQINPDTVKRFRIQHDPEQGYKVDVHESYKRGDWESISIAGTLWYDTLEEARRDLQEKVTHYY